MVVFGDELRESVNRYLQEEPWETYRLQIQELLQNAERGNANALVDLKDRMEGSLQFGTAGIRAKMEAGYLRINRVSMARVAWGIAAYLASIKAEGGLVVGYDGRLYSQLFAHEMAAVFSCFARQVWLFKMPSPTPLCAYAVSKVGAAAGIMVTASHNPKEYNGCKVYGANGAQMPPSQDRLMEQYISRAPSFLEIQSRTNHFSKCDGVQLPDGVVDSYFQAIRQNSLHQRSIEQDVRVVYTPMHGVGWPFAQRALKEAGVVNVNPVPSQMEPDWNFPTVLFPNPEEKGALEKALQQAENESADLVFANDPDADRMACAVRDVKGHFQVLTGNQLGVLLGWDVLKYATSRKKKLFISTFVSSRMLSRMVLHYGGNYVDTITGFAHISEQSFKRERTANEEFVFAYEEAIGFCIGNWLRDKDGICALVRMAELYCFLKEEGKTVWDLLDQIQLEHGVMCDAQYALHFQGPNPSEKMKDTMDQIRHHGLINALDGKPIESEQDFLVPQSGLQGINMLLFEVPEQIRLLIRPSGTEPKVKFYVEVYGKAASKSDLNAVRIQLQIQLERIQKELVQLLGSV